LAESSNTIITLPLGATLFEFGNLFSFEKTTMTMRWRNFDKFNCSDAVPDHGRQTDRRTDGRNCYINIECCIHDSENWTRKRGKI